MVFKHASAPADFFFSPSNKSIYPLNQFEKVGLPFKTYCDPSAAPTRVVE